MIEVQVEVARRSALEKLLRAAVEATLEAEGVQEAEVSVALLDDDAIRQMNRRYLDHDRVTDVISFPLWSEGERVVGDVYLGADQAERQAAEAGVPMTEEFVRLAVHGTLHVLGWDHPEEAQARPESDMYRRQEEIVSRLAGTIGAGGDR